jgi:hypothetical protein
MRFLRRLLARLRRRPLRTVSGNAVVDLEYDADRRPLRGTVTWTYVDTAEEDDE